MLNVRGLGASEHKRTETEHSLRDELRSVNDQHKEGMQQQSHSKDH